MKSGTKHNSLKTAWGALLANFTSDEAFVDSLWKELKKHYTKSKRAYHNLEHLQHMFGELRIHQANIEDLEVLQFSIWFHDIIYKPRRKDNEEKSAEYAKTELKKIGLSEERIEACYRQIILTKTHQPEENNSKDDRFLVDFDLAILGQDWETYSAYCQKIRKEYWMYPNVLYKKGRSAAMKHFLEREWIYQTEYYREALEEQARGNIERELKELL